MNVSEKFYISVHYYLLIYFKTMKNHKSMIAAAKALAFILMFACAIPMQAQDTLHLNYVQIQTKIPDTTDAKIDKWIKKLNGQHVDVRVVAYYSKADFKKFAEERANDLFLILNRKARPLFNIVSVGPKKGENYQRSMVDIIYTYSSGAPAAAKAAETKKESIAKTEDKPAEAGQKATKDNKTQTAAKAPAAKEKKEPAPAGSPKAAEPAATASAPEEAYTPKQVTDAKYSVFAPASEIKTRKLMIVLMEENPKKIEKLSGKTAEMEAYRKGIQAHNENITAAFKNAWKENEVDFIKEGDMVAAGFKEKAANWMLLVPSRTEISGIPFITYNLRMFYSQGKKSQMYEKPFKISVRGEAPEESDFYLLMYKMRVYYTLQEEVNRQQLEETLAAKTLYVDKSMTEASEADFKAEYSFPFVYTGYDEANGHIKAREKNAVYLKMDANEGKLNLMIVDAETGAILARTDQGGISKAGFKKTAVGFLGSESKQSQFFPLTIY